MPRLQYALACRAGMELTRAYGVVLILATSLMVNVVQARQLGESKRARSASLPIVGAQMQREALRVQTSAGGVDLSFTSMRKPTILYYFSPSCRWCERNWRNVAVLSTATRDRYQFVAITTSERTDFEPKKVGLHVDVHGQITDAQRRAMRLGGTPHTLVVSPEGRILASWAGAYNPRLESEIERYFGVGLPGLAPR